MLTQNRIKRIRSLKTKKGRKSENLFLIEGKNLLEDYLYNSSLINCILFSKSKAHFYNSIINLCEEKTIDYYIIPDKVFKNLSDTKSPSGLLGICNIIKPDHKNYHSNRWLYLHKIKDPGNLGTILRSAAWFNIKDIGLSKDCADPYNNKVVRSAMSAHIYINIHQDLVLDEFIKNGYLIVGGDQNAKDNLTMLDLSKKIVLCLGGESKGFNNLITEKIDQMISIKKIGHGESLNVAIAGSILMNYISIK